MNSCISRDRAQRGFSIVEMMVSLVISSILVLGVGSIFMSNKLTHRVNEGVSELQETGRFALEFLSRELRMAGYRDPDNGVLPQPFFSDCSVQSGAVCTGNGTGTNGSDRLAVQYETAALQDCTGATGSLVAGDLVVNVFTVSNNVLRCRGYNPRTGAWVSATTEPLVNGVRAMQVLYGIDDAGTAGDINRYVSADTINAAGSGLNWADVRAVRVALLVCSEREVSDDDSAQSFLLLDQPSITPDSGNANDNRSSICRIYGSTVNLRNL